MPTIRPWQLPQCFLNTDQIKQSLTQLQKKAENTRMETISEKNNVSAAILGLN
jgi:hypothetical protein